MYINKTYNIYIHRMKLNMIVAICNNRGIGKLNSLPWHFKKDLRYFAQKTKGLAFNTNAIIMGKNTWLSFPGVLPNRENLIISRSLVGENIFSSPEECISYCKNKRFDNIWIIGGQTMYEHFLTHTLLKSIYITKINYDYNCDTFFPELPESFELTSTSFDIEDNIKLDFDVYEKRT